MLRRLARECRPVISDTKRLSFDLNRKFTSSVHRRLRLAYDRYDPPAKNCDDEVGSAIVFIHGLFGSKRNNRSMSKVLARDLNRPVYAIDLRNHGDSPHDVRHDYNVLRRDVVEFITDHRLSPTTLVGHSMGAKVAMSVALDNPDIVESLISVDNAPVDAALKSDFGKYILGMRRVEEAQVSKQKDADMILRDFEQDIAIRQFLLTNFVREIRDDGSIYQRLRIPLKTLAASLNNMADFPYKDSTIYRYSGPTLFIRGTTSHYVADNTLPAIGSFFPRFRLRDIDAGHWVISENPSAFREAIVDFLGTVRH